MFPYDGTLELAQTMADLPETAAKRSAVSRAYYAAFNKSRIFAEKTDAALLSEIKKEEISDTRGGVRHRGDHEAISEFLQRFSDAKIQEAGAILKRIHKDRINCDYRDNVDRLEWITKKVIESVKDILTSVP